MNPEFRSLRHTTRYPRTPLVVGLLALSVVIAVTGWWVTQHLKVMAMAPPHPVVADVAGGSVASRIAPSGAAAPVVPARGATDATDIMPVSMAERQARIYRLLAATPLNFSRHSAALTPAVDAVLSEIARELADTDFVVRVRGHSDSEGLPEYRLQLSRARAESVRAALILDGVSDERLLIEARGTREPLASNATADGRARNRRVELLLREARR